MNRKHINTFGVLQSAHYQFLDGGKSKNLFLESRIGILPIFSDFVRLKGIGLRIFVKPKWWKLWSNNRVAM